VKLPVTFMCLYRLEGHRAVMMENPDVSEWSEAFWRADRVVGDDQIGTARVSTVFIGLDHGFFAEPLIFETMIFHKADTILVDRYPTWEQAQAGHRRTIALLGGPDTLAMGPADHRPV
jgi:hypothetical protein